MQTRAEGAPEKKKAQTTLFPRGECDFSRLRRPKNEYIGGKCAPKAREKIRTQIWPDLRPTEIYPPPL